MSWFGVMLIVVVALSIWQKEPQQGRVTIQKEDLGSSRMYGVYREPVVFYPYIRGRTGTDFASCFA